VSAVSPSARSLVVGFSDVLAASRNLLLAVEAHGDALLMAVTVSAATDNALWLAVVKCGGSREIDVVEY